MLRGKVDYPDNSTPFKLDIVVQDGSVTGQAVRTFFSVEEGDENTKHVSVGSERASALYDIKVDGDKLHFKVNGDNDVVTDYELEIDGDSSANLRVNKTTIIRPGFEYSSDRPHTADRGRRPWLTLTKL